MEDRWRIGARRGSAIEAGGPREKREKNKMISSIRPRSTYVNQSGVVALLEIVQYCGVVQVSQIGHVFDAFEFRRIDRVAMLFLERFLLF